MDAANSYIFYSQGLDFIPATGSTIDPGYEELMNELFPEIENINPSQVLSEQQQNIIFQHGQLEGIIQQQQTLISQIEQMLSVHQGNNTLVYQLHQVKSSMTMQKQSLSSVVFQLSYASSQLGNITISQYMNNIAQQGISSQFNAQVETQDGPALSQFEQLDVLPVNEDHLVPIHLGPDKGFEKIPNLAQDFLHTCVIDAIATILEQQPNTIVIPGLNSSNLPRVLMDVDQAIITNVMPVTPVMDLLHHRYYDFFSEARAHIEAFLGSQPSPTYPNDPPHYIPGFFYQIPSDSDSIPVSKEFARICEHLLTDEENNGLGPPSPRPTLQLFLQHVLEGEDDQQPDRLHATVPHPCWQKARLSFHRGKHSLLAFVQMGYGIWQLDRQKLPQYYGRNSTAFLATILINILASWHHKACTMLGGPIASEHMEFAEDYLNTACVRLNDPVGYDRLLATYVEYKVRFSQEHEVSIESAWDDEA
ncbi:hypothetical protein A0H81_14209 [Grifola frondosa]|uniref:Uncharacterized protein n=1 Tax=Grifola frondosa TaxID=5627 RepID=A0A1C7LME9_GRIFR|nr:hypothetical protein A0H81_14209 [Grifola frondosa]